MAMDGQLSLKQAVSLHQTGKLVEAERLYRQVLKAERKNFPAHYMLAVLLYQQQREPDALKAVVSALKLNPNALEALALHSVLLLNAGQHKKALASISKVVARQPGDAEAWHNRGVILSELRRFEEAVDSFDKALAIRSSAEAWTNRGAALLKLMRPEDALRSFDKALAIKPTFAGALYNRGNALMDLERYPDAVTAFDKLLAQNPNSFEAWNNRGAALHELKRFTDSLESYDRAVEIQPDYASAWTNRGKSLQELKRYDDALVSYDKSLALDSGSLELWYARALTLRTVQRVEDALACVDKALAIQKDFKPALSMRAWLLCELNRITDGLTVFRRVTELTLSPEDGGRPLDTAHKQRHDAEQNDYLVAQGVSVKNGESYFADGDKIETPAINLANTAPATAQWEQSRPRIVVIDNLLSDEALEKLRRYCWGSTIWRRSYESGYLGAMPEEGFACPLLAQIAEELRDTFPSIIGDNRLRMLWGFKYDSRLEGIKIHADQAAVNVNFWITPDEANQNSESGGIVVWDVTAPKDWEPEKYNGDEAAMRAFLNRTGAKPITVPHRANRAVIFDSDLFHETDNIDFKEGYLNRRINITMLYGRRTYYGS
jgi:tetratricopeptide (TPR) repeat protein